MEKELQMVVWPSSWTMTTITWYALIESAITFCWRGHFCHLKMRNCFCIFSSRKHCIKQQIQLLETGFWDLVRSTLSCSVNSPVLYAIHELSFNLTTGHLIQYSVTETDFFTQVAVLRSPSQSHCGDVLVFQSQPYTLTRYFISDLSVNKA